VLLLAGLLQGEQELRKDWSFFRLSIKPPNRPTFSVLSSSQPRPFSLFLSPPSPPKSKKQAAWPQHKAAHKPDPLTQWAYATNKGAGRSFSAPATFPWTGKLRPEKIGPSRRVPEGIALPDYATSSIPFSEQESKQQHSIPIRNEREIAKARAACRIGREVLDEAARAVRPGVTTDELDRVVHEATVERGAYPSPLNYYSFPKSVCTSVNEVVCHGIPDAR